MPECKYQTFHKNFFFYMSHRVSMHKHASVAVSGFFLFNIKKRFQWNNRISAVYMFFYPLSSCFTRKVLDGTPIFSLISLFTILNLHDFKDTFCGS